MCSGEARQPLILTAPPSLMQEFTEKIERLYARVNEHKRAARQIFLSVNSGSSRVDRTAALMDEISHFEAMERELTAWNVEHRWILETDIRTLVQVAHLDIRGREHQDLRAWFEDLFVYHEKEAEMAWAMKEANLALMEERRAPQGKKASRRRQR